MSTATGASEVIVFYFEGSEVFAQDPSSAYTTSSEATPTELLTFGVNETFDPDSANNPERQYRPFDRQAELILESGFDGSWSADFTVSNWNFLDFFYGDDASSISPDDPPKTFQVVDELQYPDGSIEQTVYIGCAASSFNLDVSVDDVVSCSLDGEYATEKSKLINDPNADTNPGTTGDLVLGESIITDRNGQPERENRPYHFGNATVQLDFGSGKTPPRGIQDVTLDLEQNLQLEYELGSRFATVPTFLQIEPSLDYTNLVSDSTKDQEKTAMYGDPGANSGEGYTEPQELLDGAGIAASVNFDTGITDDPNVTANITGAFPDNFSRSNLGDPQEVLEDDVSRMVDQLTFDVTTN